MGGHRRLTVCGGRGVGSREERLRGSALPLEGLENCADLISDLGVVIDLALEVLEDLEIYHARGVGHDGWGRVERWS